MTGAGLFGKVNIVDLVVLVVIVAIVVFAAMRLTGGRRRRDRPGKAHPSSTLGSTSAGRRTAEQRAPSRTLGGNVIGELQSVQVTPPRKSS